MTINDAQQEVDKWINSVGVRYFSEMTNLAILMEEVGELSRIFSRTYGEQSFKEGENTNIKEKISEEMADIFWVLLCLSNQTGIDLEVALKESFRKKTERDGERHKNNPKLNR